MAGANDVSEIDSRLAEALGHPRWKPDLDPLPELIQTILSQHTSSANSQRAFERLQEQLPTWEAIRDAPAEVIAAAISGAGLARQKAPRIKRILELIWQERQDFDLSFLADMPAQGAMAWLRRLPGVGQTTAACVLLFGLGRPVMPVDTGIQRIATRLGLGTAADQVQRTLERGVPAERVYPLHVNLIRFGRQICLPSEPLCGVCPLNDLCDYFRTAGRVGRPRDGHLPTRARKRR